MFFDIFFLSLKRVNESFTELVLVYEENERVHELLINLTEQVQIKQFNYFSFADYNPFYSFQKKNQFLLPSFQINFHSTGIRYLKKKY